jgi:hypothetical protein
MEQELDEGKQFDEQMTKLAEDEINPRMIEDEEEGEEDEEGEEEQGNGSSRGRRASRRKSR